VGAFIETHVLLSLWYHARVLELHWRKEAGDSQHAAGLLGKGLSYSNPVTMDRPFPQFGSWTESPELPRAARGRVELVERVRIRDRVLNPVQMAGTLEC
jgi:hypothetical protein